MLLILQASIHYMVELALTHLFQTQSTAILRQFSLDH
nr:MAG TPA: hypothetical protein [Caudoviricetes sp.]